MSDKGVSKTLTATNYKTPPIVKQHESGVGKGRRTHVVEYSRKSGVGKELDIAHTLNSSDWRGLNRNQKQNAVLEHPHYRIRKLTPRL